ncbi:MATE family efflux transporter [Acinetobacter schindleri]|uniref:lipopolysaccharide biosynthesis protein n=1 Tax=Acinetobacter schindleri TaxID=108981 RepID=UPI0028D0540B|nr:MATE family efflux transporter [Acinetobacter schindleri]
MVSNNKRIVKNSIFLLSRTIFLTLVTLYTLREVIAILGPDQFGLYSVVFGIVTMFAFINGALLSGAQRFLSFDIGKNDILRVKKTFITSIYIHLITSIIISLLIYSLRDYLIENILNINEFKKEAFVVYNYAVLSIFISILQVPFSALITAHERMQAFAYLAIVDGILKLVLVYLLCFFEFNKTIFYSSLVTLISFIIFISHILYCYFNFKNLMKFDLIKISELKILMKSMLNFIGWNLIGNLSLVMRNQGANVILNIFFGLKLNAAFSISMTLMAAISSLLSSISNAINPQIYKNYASGNLKNYFNLIDYGTKFCMIVISMLIIPIIYCMEYILKLWLKNIPIYAIEFSQLSLFLVLVETYSILIVSAIQATGEIRRTQIGVGSLLLINIPITYLLFRMDFNPEIILIVPAFIAFIAFFLRMHFLMKITGYQVKRYFIKVFCPVFLIQFFMILGILTYDIIYKYPNSFLEFIYFMLFFGLYSIFLAYLIGLSKKDKTKVRLIATRKVKN